MSTIRWPSRGELTKGEYHADEATVRWTVPHLESLLTDIAARTEAEEIHLIAHRLENCNAMIGALRTRSRDFH